MANAICLKGLFGKSKKQLQFEIRKLNAELKGMEVMTKAIAEDREALHELVDELNTQIRELQRKLTHEIALKNVARIKIADMERRNRELKIRAEASELTLRKTAENENTEAQDEQPVP